MFSTVDGSNQQNPNKFDKLYFFGGRSFSVFRADNFSLVYDSGDEVERQHAIFFPEVFNAEGKSSDPGDESPEDKFDIRSDNKVRIRPQNNGFGCGYACKPEPNTLNLDQ